VILDCAQASTRKMARDRALAGLSGNFVVTEDSKVVPGLIFLTSYKKKRFT
jgi:hypothetical protein